MNLHLLISFLFLTSVFAFYEESQYVKELDADNFEAEIIDGKDTWIVQFFSTSDNDCHAYSDEYEKIGKALRGFIKVGAVDVNRARLLAYRYNIQKLPTLVYIFRDGTTTKHKGAKRPGDLVNVAANLIWKQMNESLIDKYIDLPYVKELTKSDIEKHVNVTGRWIVAYIDSKTSEDNDFKESFANLADKLKDNIKFAYHDVEKSDLGVNVRDTPTIMFYFGKRSNRSELEYTGKIEPTDDVLSWILANVRRPEVLEQYSEDSLRELCINKKYCIITLIDTAGNCDKNCKSEARTMLSNLAEKYKYYSAAWTLVRKGQMSMLEDIFSITISTKLPAMLVVNVQTLKSKDIEEVNEAKGQEFLEDIFHGSGFPEYRLPGFDSLLQEHYKPWHDEL